MKPRVRERSQGYCESWPFVRDNCDLETQDLYHPEGGLASVCAIRATNVHHRKYRSRRGTNALDNLIDLCTPCHAWIHAHGKFDGPANKLRLALSAGESESLTM